VSRRGEAGRAVAIVVGACEEVGPRARFFGPSTVAFSLSWSSISLLRGVSCAFETQLLHLGIPQPLGSSCHRLKGRQRLHSFDWRTQSRWDRTCGSNALCDCYRLRASTFWTWRLVCVLLEKICNLCLSERGGYSMNPNLESCAQALSL